MYEIWELHSPAYNQIFKEALEVVVKSRSVVNHGFQNRTGPGGWTVKTGNRDENRFFKPKEPDFLLIL